VSTVTDGIEGPFTELWRKFPPTDHKWLWSKFTESLNELNPDTEAILSPDDSRLRLDRKYLQLDNLDIAGKEKHRLEEVQRAKRKEREAKGEEWTTRYFQKVEDPTYKHRYKYTGKYWEEREERIRKYEQQKLSKEENSPPKQSPKQEKKQEELISFD